MTGTISPRDRVDLVIATIFEETVTRIVLDRIADHAAIKGTAYGHVFLDGLDDITCRHVEPELPPMLDILPKIREPLPAIESTNRHARRRKARGAAKRRLFRP